jgi:hypothetical protein
MERGHSSYKIDFSEVLTRMVKYALEGLVVALAAYAVPQIKLDLNEIVTIALVASAAFSLLDFVSPSMGSAARFGAGAGIGANLVSFPGKGPVRRL